MYDLSSLSFGRGRPPGLAPRRRFAAVQESNPSDGIHLPPRLHRQEDRPRRKLKGWYVKYRDADGIVRRVPGYADREATKQLAARLERDAARRQEGMIDPCVEQQCRPLAEHLDDYRRQLLAKGDTEKHARQTARYAEAVLDGCRFVFIPDLSASAVAEFLHGLRRGRRPRTAARTGRVHEKGAAESLGRPPRQRGADAPPRRPDGDRQGQGPALPAGDRGRAAGRPRRRPRPVHQQRLPDRREGVHALAGARPPHGRRSARLPVARQRRRRPARPPPAAGRGGLRALLAAASASAEVFRGLAGRDRAALYSVAMTTGFRVAELASLTPASFDLAAEPATATVKAAYSKNRRESVQPLPADVAAALRGYLGGRPAAAPVWPRGWVGDAAKCCASTWRPR